MNIKKQFLSLSIKHQISFVIASISILSLLLILALFSLYGNIIINIRLRSRQEYFHERYKLIFDSQIDFQNFLLYQYEQLLKLFNEELYYFSTTMDDFDESFFNNKNIPFKINDYKTDESSNEITSIEEYYKLNYKNIDTCDIYDFTRNYILLHNHMDNIKKMRILYLGINGVDHHILDDFILASLLCKNLLSNNKKAIKEIKENSNNNIDEYYENKIKKHHKNILNLLEDYKYGNFNLVDVLYPKYVDIFENYKNLNLSEDNITNYLNNISHYFTSLDYTSDMTFSLESQKRLIQEYSFIPDYINNLFLKIQSFINLNTIPVYKENNTIVSKDLCFSFLYKQILLLNLSSEHNFSKEQIDNIYDSLKSGETIIDDCILGEKYNIGIKENINSFIKNKHFDNYYSIISKRDTALFQLSEATLAKSFLGTKYTFPDYSSIIDFSPLFFTLEQLNLYCFSSFHEPSQVIKNMINFYNICQYLMILLLLYLWIIIYIYLRIKLQKIYREVIKPINDLNDKISQLDIREENQLKFESDDSINELFKLCNELLLGKYKKKLMHESELVIEKMDKEKNNNLNNLKIDRKIIEQMIENKNKYNNVENDIFIYKSSQEKIISLKPFTRERKKLNTVFNQNRSVFSLNIDKKTRESSNEKSKKMSANESMLFNPYEELFQTSNSELIKLEKDDNYLEIKSAMNYKFLYEIVDLVYNYDIEFGRNFIPKKNKLLYKENIRTFNKFKKGKNKKNLNSYKEEEKSKSDTIDKISTFNEIKDDGNVKLEDFDKSVVNAYGTKNLLFIWYEEAKLVNNIEFLQQDHDKELKDLCKIIFNSNTENKTIEQNQSNNTRKINFKESRNKTLRKFTSLGSGFDNAIRKSRINPEKK